MSVHPTRSPTARRYQVRWREGNGRVRTRSFPSKKRSQCLRHRGQGAQAKGVALPQPGRETLAAAYDEWWHYFGPELAQNTQKSYRGPLEDACAANVRPVPAQRVGLQPPALQGADRRHAQPGRWQRFAAKGTRGDVCCFQCCRQWKKSGSTPCWRCESPLGRASAFHIHSHRWWSSGSVSRCGGVRQRTRVRARSLADACFVVLMSYAGLRPGEAFALTWERHRRADARDRQGGGRR